MKKRLALLGLALIFVLGSVFGGVFGTLLANRFAKAASGDLHEAGIANYRIQQLPKKSYEVGDKVPTPEIPDGDVCFTITRKVSDRDIVTWVSDASALAGHPGANGARVLVPGTTTFSLPGVYTYNFYSTDEYEDLRMQTISGNLTGMLMSGPMSFHSFSTTVYSTNFRIELPENDRDILPNITIPNPATALPGHAQYNANSVITPVVLPLPKSMIDTRGRDLLDIDPDNTDARDARREAYLPELMSADSAIVAAYPDRPAAGATTAAKIAYFFEGATPKVTDAKIVEWIYRDSSITFFGNPERPQPVKGIADRANRTFIPITDGGQYYAEYKYENTHSKISASYRTNNIIVERPVLPTGPSGITLEQVPSQILFNPIPETSFTPSEGTFRIGTEAALPTATVNIHEESKVQFDNAVTVSSFTYIAVRWRPRGSNDRAWRWIGQNADGSLYRRQDGTLGLPNTSTDEAKENDPRIMRITDFKFTPSDVGDYQFWYYTTTIFGVGKDTDLKDRVHANTIFGGTSAAPRRYIKNQPFGNITIERDNRAPEIKWTADFDYDTRAGATFKQPMFGNTYEKVGGGTTTNPAEAATEIVDRVRYRKVVTWGTPADFEDVKDLSNWLPGSTTASKTRIARGDDLVVPALLGDSNSTASNSLNYQLFLYRYHEGVRSNNYVYWSSGLNSGVGTLNGSDWRHNETFRIPFRNAGLTTFPHDGHLLSRWGGEKIEGRYDIMVRAYDSDNNISSQFQYTFEVIGSVDDSRPVLSGLFNANQNEYHEGDTLRFNLPTFTDTYTDDRDIEVKYYLSFKNGADILAATNPAPELKDGEDGVSIVGGIASVELDSNYEVGDYLLRELKREEAAVRVHNGHLAFRIYAVARNYHAITRDINLDDAGYEIAKLQPRPITSTSNHPFFITVEFTEATIYDLSFGSAAYISEIIRDYSCRQCLEATHDSDCEEEVRGKWTCAADCPVFGHAHDTLGPVASANPVVAEGFSSSWYTNEKMGQDQEIAIPALRFWYGNDPLKPAQLYSTVTYSVTFDGNRRDVDTYVDGALAYGGLWQGNIAQQNNYIDDKGMVIGNLENNDANQRYFLPMGVGTHYITATVTNAGGNISVFVGTILIVGTPQATSRLIGARTEPMRVGESQQMPTVEVTIDGKRYVTGTALGAGRDNANLLGFLVTADINENLGRQARVGTIEVRGRSENNSEPGMRNNIFTPSAVDTYTFTYIITITDKIEFEIECAVCGTDFDCAGGCDIQNTTTRITNIPALSPADSTPLTVRETWRIAVNPLDTVDMEIELDADLFQDRFDWMLDETAAGDPARHRGDLNTYFDMKDAGNDAAAYKEGNYYDPSRANVHNFFTDMLVSNTTGKLLEMSDEQLFGGLEPVETSGNTLPTQWQYGRIFIPNYSKQLASQVSGLGADFTANANSWITVEKGTTKLLDTRLFNLDDDTNPDNKIDFSFSEEGYAWFRPTGLLEAQYASAMPENTPNALQWAKENAINKELWEPVAASQNNVLRVDGEYVVTYTIEYMGIEISKTYKIAMGDTRAPRITLLTPDDPDQLTKTYQVGDLFKFNTVNVHVTGTRDASVFLFEDGMDSWLANSQNNDNFSITIMTYGGQILTPGDDHDYEIVIDYTNGTEDHSFRFREPGTYYITFRVTSPSGVPNSREYRITVEDDTKKAALAPEEVWGTILIIVSIGLFLAVIIYFVRTGQQTKFASAKNKTKKSAKEKEDKEKEKDAGVV